MAEIVHTNCKVWMGGYDMSGNLNAAAINYGADAPEATTFGDDTHRMIGGGLKTVDVAHEGYWEGTDIDAHLFSKIAVGNEPMTISPTTGAVGEPAYFLKSVLSTYTPGGAIGEVLAFSVAGSLTDGSLQRGTILVNASGVVASGNSTATELGAVSDTQELTAALHVTAASGTLDVTVNSDVDNTFATPATQITFAQATAIGSEILSTAGPVTDTWWRIDYTVTGTFDFVVAVAIQ